MSQDVSWPRQPVLDGGIWHQTLCTHSKKSSRSGGYWLKLAVRFLAASRLARQESWAERGSDSQCRGSRAPLPPSPSSCSPGQRSAPPGRSAAPGRRRGRWQRAGHWPGHTGILAGARLRGCDGEMQLRFTSCSQHPMEDEPAPSLWKSPFALMAR